MTIVVTVPHATCPRHPSGRHRHPCDTAAPTAARVLTKSLEETGLTVVAFYATTPRTISDMNRAESRGTEWRNAVDDYLGSHSVRYLLDVHSFPPEHEALPFDIALMTLGEAEPWHVALAEAIANHSNLKVGRAIGSMQNDIMFTARTRGIRTVLLEFREDLSPAQIKSACDAIAKFV